jgi:hypothetical protein
MPYDPRKFFDVLRRLNNQLTQQSEPERPTEPIQQAPQGPQAQPTEPGQWIPTANVHVRQALIAKAARELRLLSIKYKGREYTIEPYSIKMVGGGMKDGQSVARGPRVTSGPVLTLYGRCVEHMCQHNKKGGPERIHSFHMSGIAEIKIRYDQPIFKPIWKIEIQ